MRERAVSGVLHQQLLRLLGLHADSEPEPEPESEPAPALTSHARNGGLVSPTSHLCGARASILEAFACAASMTPVALAAALASILSASCTRSPSQVGLPLGTAFRDCAECPEMVAVPGGTAHIGPASDEESAEDVPADWRGLVHDRHAVVIDRAFAVGRFPVTRGEFRRFVEATGATVSGCVNYYGDRWVDEPHWNWSSTSFHQDDRHPVVCVSWHDAREYAGWLARVTGLKYRLLTENEWEHAARGGTNTRRYWGDDSDHDEQCAFANGADLSYARQFPSDGAANLMCDDGFTFTAPVGTFRPNRFGLYDMQGNVTEWTNDCFRRDGDAASSCAMRVLRGGAWSDPTWGLRAADRYRDLPDTRCMGIGFRVARDL